MRRFLDLVVRFRRDEGGMFAVIFGLMAVVLVALSGAVVDYVTLEQSRGRSQIALDAAALALQPEIFDKPLNVADIEDKAEKLLLERLGTAFGASASNIVANANVELGQLTLQADLTVPTSFVSLVGVPRLNARIHSQATRRMLELEVALVLDNSGSMAGTPMSNLKTAACNAVNILFFGKSGTCAMPSGSPTPNPKVRVSLVPFTHLVNIGTQYANEPWLDWSGKSSISTNNFDNDDDETTPFKGPVDRRQLFRETNTSWAGCVEARISPFDTTDDPPNTNERLFLPLFSPDTYASTNNYISGDAGGTCKPKTCTQVTRRTCTGNKTNCTVNPTYDYTKTHNGVTTPMGTTSCVPAGATPTTTSETYPNNSTQVVTSVYNLLTPRERQDRMCKYMGTDQSDSRTNYTCPTATVRPLTGSPSTVLSAINAMVADGSTNIQQGTVWGMHALTNTAPMTEAREAAPGNLSKVMIVMTDGKNDPATVETPGDMNGSTYFSWGFRYDGRLGEREDIDTEAKLTKVMDDRTLAACTFAKEQRGIEIYVIGLNSSTATKAMMTKCASSTAHAYFPTQASQLNSVFEDIAGKLAALRLSQ